MGLVEGDVGDVFPGEGEVNEALRGWVVAPGAHGVEVGEQGGVKAGGEDLAAEFGGEGGGEVLEHDQGDEEGVAGGPGGGLGVEEAELEREVGPLDGDGGVDPAGVELEVVELVGGESGGGAVGGGAELEGALGAVVGECGGAEDLGEGSGGVATEGFHLPEAVLGGNEALGDDQVVDRGGVDGGDPVVVALDGDGSGEAGKGERAVELGEGVAHGMAGPEAGAEERGDEQDEDEGERDGEVAGEFGGGAGAVD